MSVLGTNLAQSLGGLPQTERAAAVREAERRRSERAQTIGRREDEVDVQTYDNVGAVRSLKDNTDEETADDRRQHDHYRTDTRPEEAQRGSLDVSA